MKQHKINSAFNALNKLMGMELKVRDAYAVFMLRRKLEPSYEFELERERGLISKYDGTILPNGTITFPAEDDAQRFREEIAEMNESEIELEFEPITLNFDALGEQKILPADLAALEGFIRFE